MHAIRRRRPTLQGLALVASLLLALLPAAGRLHRAFAPTADPAVVVAMCTVEGLRYLPSVAPWGDDGGRVAGDDGSSAPSDPRGTPAHAGFDCAYCPLLTTLDLPDTAGPLPGLPEPPVIARPHLRQGHLPARHLLGWAPRGPPRAPRAA